MISEIKNLIECIAYVLAIVLSIHEITQWRKK